MTTRKPKTPFSPVIEWPTEQLQWVPITVEHKPAGPESKTQWPRESAIDDAAIDDAEELEELLADYAAREDAWRRRLH